MGIVYASPEDIFDRMMNVAAVLQIVVFQSSETPSFDPTAPPKPNS